MVEVQKYDGGFLIENVLLFGASSPNPDFINLSKQKWDDVIYEKFEYKFVNYPGEYDLNNTVVKCILWKDEKLSYIIYLNWEKIWLIQTPDALKDESISDMDTRLYTEPSIAEKIDHMELEGFKKELEQ